MEKIKKLKVSMWSSYIIGVAMVLFTLAVIMLMPENYIYTQKIMLLLVFYIVLGNSLLDTYSFKKIEIMLEEIKSKQELK